MIENSPVGNKLVGFFRGQVVLHLTHGYCKIYIPAVYPLEWKDNPKLIPPAELASSLFAGTNTGSGAFTYPNIGSIVWVFFANNDLNYPVYFASSLGGENAFGQYEIVKRPDEEVSERHLITSGKTHIEWYENGKLSVQVEDPDRRDASVDYNNAYIGLISDDAVSARPICEKVAAEELSNIHCKLVFDNDNNTYGSISAQTHHYDLQKDDNVNMTLTNDNDFILDNNGNIKLEELSTHTFKDSTNDIKRTNHNIFSMIVPGKTNLENHLTSTINSAAVPIDHIESDIAIATTTDGSISHDIHVLKNQETSDKNIILTNATLSKQQSIGSGYKSSMSYLHTDKNAKISIKNDLTSDVLANDGMNATKTFHMTSVGLVTDPVNIEFKDNFDAAKATIERSVDNILKKITSYDNTDATKATTERKLDNLETKITSIDKVDATNSEHTIKLEDKNSGNTSYVTMNTKDGALTISMEGSGHCTVVMKSDGTMTIDTTDKMTVTTTNAVDVSTKKITMNGSEQIDIVSPKINIGTSADAITIGDAGKTTTKINGSDGDCKIKNVSLLNHKHYEEQSGDVVTGHTVKTDTALNSL